MSPEEINILRLEVKSMIAGQDLDMPGGRDKLQSLLAEKLGRPINRNSVVMALSGYRRTLAYVELLIALKELLNRENIHPSKAISNEKAEIPKTD